MDTVSTSSSHTLSLIEATSNLASVKEENRGFIVKVGSESDFRTKKEEKPMGRSRPKVFVGEGDYVLEDVPHLTDYIHDLPTYTNPLQFNPSYSVVKQYFVNPDDSVAQKVVVRKSGPRGTHFRRAGPREKAYFEPDEVSACIVTCGGLCPGLNTVIRELVCGLYHMYGVTKVLGIEGGYKGFYARNTIPLTPKVVNDIHKRGGTILGTSRGGQVTMKIVDSIQDRRINQVYIIGGDGTQKGAATIYEDCCLIPESPFHLEGEGGLYEFMEHRLRENGHMVIVIAEGVGQNLIAESLLKMEQKDASGNKLLFDVGLWLSHKIK